MSGYREVWDSTIPTSGYVCGTCGMPVESEPCAEHEQVESALATQAVRESMSTRDQ